ncbi:MAG: DUF6524 family protein [Steroidobacteraceae bacterium]
MAVALDRRDRPAVVLAGIALVIGWGVYLSATLRSLGLMGMLLWAAFFGALVWTAVFYDWLSLRTPVRLPGCCW